jgi:hypothetical protein
MQLPAMADASGLRRAGLAAVRKGFDKSADGFYSAPVFKRD